MKRLISCLAFLVVLLTACKKESFINSADARVNISTDSLRFDTVFTSVGSITQSFKISNDNDQKLRLSQVKLMGGSNSPFRININGVAANELSNIDIAAEDSIYVFVSVTVDPSTANLPFILSDSISIQYNGNQRWVQLEAYGQNARFINAGLINSNTLWDATKPYVILDFLNVAPGASLTILPGTKIYAHANAPIIIDGTLNATGSVSAPISFSGDRLDAPYRNYPASWPGIIFRSSSLNNHMQFVKVLNAYQAVIVDQPATNANPKLVIDQCIIDNAYDAGIFARNTSIAASNVLISNCANNISIQAGGSYNFIHCTAASYSNNFLLHKTPVLSVSNFTLQNGSPVSSNLQANFTNCIFWGDAGFVDNEVIVRKEGSAPFSVSFNNSLFRAQNEPTAATLINVIRNQEPLFDSIDVSNRYFDFRHTKSPAPGINAGLVSSISKDLDNNNRPVGLPDMGCFEKQ
ncbi:MAG: hypothetical protein EOO06_20560 [Chitinophagaceae bacterium]|nr:MAG: hypothetical protein EOO06_20560 [Chitinophagaceae bacterium]